MTREEMNKQAERIARMVYVGNHSAFVDELVPSRDQTYESNLHDRILGGLIQAHNDAIEAAAKEAKAYCGETESCGCDAFRITRDIEALKIGAPE